MTLRRTKIVATIGPACDQPGVLEQLILAGMNVARLNFSHGTADEHRQRAACIRELARKHGRHVALLGDLQGPKIRIARFTDGKIELQAGDRFAFSISHPKDAGTRERVCIDYPALVTDCNVGDELLLDDGRVILRIEEVTPDSLECRVLVGGNLSDHKGINKRGGGLTAPALTDKDRQDILLATELELEYIAVSFPRDAADMLQARQLCDEAGSQAWLVAKIERAEAVNNDEVLAGLIEASDAVMVARGDLAVEIGDAELVGIQKKIIAAARRHNKAVITATQMMESMISSPTPTRAEVSDVANAVLDHTDAVMLSAETAAGQFPVEAVAAMARICMGAERSPALQSSSHRIGRVFGQQDESIALATMYIANHYPGVRAIIALTESGRTPLVMTRIRTTIPVYAFSSNRMTQTRVALFRGVETIAFNPSEHAENEVCSAAIEQLLTRNIVQPGDQVILTMGDVHHCVGCTNTMKILQVQASQRPENS